MPTSTTARRRTLSLALAASLLLMAGCTADGPDGTAEKTSTASPSPSPTALALDDITDAPSQPIEYPTIEIPDGVTPAQLDWMLRLLLPVAQRSVQHGTASSMTEAEATEWALGDLQHPEADRVAWLEEFFGGPGYSFAVATRIAPDAELVATPHVLGQEWTAENADGRLRTAVELEVAFPFAEGVAVATRTITLSADLDRIRTEGTFLPGVGFSARRSGIDTCRLLTEGVLAPGDLSEVVENAETLRDRDAGGVSAWAAKDGETSSPADDREECLADGA